MTFLKEGKNLKSKFSIVAIIGFIVFLSIIFILHFMQSGYDASEKYVSEFIFGEYGWLLNIAIVGNLIGCGAFTIAFYYFHISQKSLICLLCLCVVTLSVFTNFFPIDVHGKTVTVSGHIHNIGGFIGTLAIFPVMTIFPFQLMKIGMLKGIYFLLALLALLAPIAFIFLLITINSAPNFVGIGQRIYASIIMLWLIIAALRLQTGEFTEK